MEDEESKEVSEVVTKLLSNKMPGLDEILLRCYRIWTWLDCPLEVLDSTCRAARMGEVLTLYLDLLHHSCDEEGAEQDVKTLVH